MLINGIRNIIKVLKNRLDVTCKENDQNKLIAKNEQFTCDIKYTC